MSVRVHHVPQNISIQKVPVRVRLATREIVNLFQISLYEEVNGEAILIPDSTYYETIQKTRIDGDQVIELLDQSVNIGGDTANNNYTNNTRYCIWVGPDNQYAYSVWSEEVEEFEFFNLDGTAYTGPRNALVIFADTDDESGDFDVQPMCVNGVETVYRLSYYSASEGTPVILWQNAEGVIVPRPTGSIIGGACQIRSCCEHTDVWEKTEEGAYRPIHRVRLYDGTTGTSSTTQYFDYSGRIYAPVGEIVTVLPGVTYQSLTINLTEEQTFNLDDYEDYDISGVSVSMMVPIRSECRVTLEDAGGVQTFTRNYQFDLNGHNDTDSISGRLRIIRYGTRSRVVIVLRIRMRPVVIGSPSIKQASK